MSLTSIFASETLELFKTQDNIFVLSFRRDDKTVNRVDIMTRNDLSHAISKIEKQKNIKGLIINSIANLFMAGADLTEFEPLFSQDKESIIKNISEIHALFNAIEDFPFPTVCIINGVALGGGFEVALSTDYRVMDSNGSIGFPEVNFGIFPAWGGTIRLSRLCGLETSIEWIAGGRNQNAKKALLAGAVDSVDSQENLFAIATGIIDNCNDGKLDYLNKRLEKTKPIKLNSTEIDMAVQASLQQVLARTMVGNSAPKAVVELIKLHATENRLPAQKLESNAAVDVAKNPIVATLIASFLQSTKIESDYKHFARDAKNVTKVAVIGAGVMGAGIAYQNALKGTSALLKDIRQDVLDKAINIASNIASKRLKRKKLTPQSFGSLMGSLSTSLNYSGFNDVELVIEAVSEDLEIKSSVLIDTEKNLPVDSIMTSNTSTISITSLASSLSRPENFCGMHFFNPVDRMLLVEIIKGKNTSKETVQRVLKHATKMGKKPVVINDCAGFLVNRILYPYFLAFCQLVEEGQTVKSIDKAMQNFGWPMGPGMLIDIIGIDVLVHSSEILAKAYADRMQLDKSKLLASLMNDGLLGQKNGNGFYKHSVNSRGRPKSVVNDAIIHYASSKTNHLTDEEIVARLMFPMCIEAVRCLDDKIIATAAELDYALSYGVGFPPTKGGPIRFIENFGLNDFCKATQALSKHGNLYEPTSSLIKKAHSAESYFANS